MLFRSVERLKQDFFSHIVSTPDSFPFDANSDETELLFSNLSDFISSYLTSTNQKITSLMKESSQGIFFINSSFRIEEEFSNNLKEFFGESALARKRFDTLLNKKIPTKVIEDVNEFLVIMFKTEIELEDIEDMNPLKQIEYTTHLPNGLMENKLLKFEFKRIMDNSGVKYLTVFINDIKQKKELEEKLSLKKDELSKQFDIFFTLMTIDPDQFEDFLEELSTEIISIHTLLKDTEKDDEEKLEGLFSSISYITEYSKALNVLDLFTQIEKLNYSVQTLKIKTNVTAHDFFSILYLIDDLEKFISYLDSFNKQFLEFKNKYVRQKNVIEKNVVDFVTSSVDRICKSNDIPKLKLDIKDVEDINPKILTTLKNVIEQLLNFSIHYSLTGKKNAEILLTIHSTKPGELVLVYKDLGKGLEYDDLKFFYDNSFESEKPFFHYFDIVRKRLKPLHPKISVDSEYGKFFELIIIFSTH